MQTRRRFLARTTAALALAGVRPAMATTMAMQEITAREALAQLAPPAFPQTAVWSYDDGIPGPMIRLSQGDRLRRRLVNDLPEPTSIHWHGIRIDNAMDGVSGLTQQAVEPGQSFDYDFALPDAGTYWYHAHNRSWVQVARGLHGPLIVEEAEPLDIDLEDVLVLDDWLLDPATAQINADFYQPMTLSHAGRLGNLVSTNGRYDYSLSVRRNDRIRLRLINASNARILPLQLVGLRGWTVALDGMPLATPEVLDGVLVLAPAQRADLIVDVIAEDGETAHLARLGQDGNAASQAAFPVTGARSTTPRGAPPPLPPNPRTDLLDLGATRSERLVMSGGAMGRMTSAILGGERVSAPELAGQGRYWSLNDLAEMPQTPLADLAFGETVRMTIVNDTLFPHAMHLHGMHFRELMPEDRQGPLRDTLLIGANETREIAFAADNPGDWLFHCHMLSHAAAGMTTWVRVS